MECHWTISATSDTRVAVFFDDSYLSGASCGYPPASRRAMYGSSCAMSIEPQSDCNYDRLSAIRGNKVASSANQFAVELENSVNRNGEYRLCGDAIPAPKPLYSTSTGGYSITWSFRSDFVITKAGFYGQVTLAVATLPLCSSTMSCDIIVISESSCCILASSNRSAGEILYADQSNWLSFYIFFMRSTCH